MRHFTKHILAAIIAISILASCTKDDPIAELQSIEQTNLKFTGDIEYFDIQSGDNFDLIQTSVISNKNSAIKFTIQLENGHDLILNLYNKYATNVWETPTNFPIYPTAEMPSHWKYSQVSYVLANDAAGYDTHLGDIAPTITDISPIRITDFNADKMEVKVQLENLTLYKNGDSRKTVTVNGTFVSNITINQ